MNPHRSYLGSGVLCVLAVVLVAGCLKGATGSEEPLQPGTRTESLLFSGTLENGFFTSLIWRSEGNPGLHTTAVSSAVVAIEFRVAWNGTAAPQGLGLNVHEANGGVIGRGEGEDSLTLTLRAPLPRQIQFYMTCRGPVGACADVDYAGTATFVMTSEG